MAIRDELELSIDDALRQVDALGAALDERLAAAAESLAVSVASVVESIGSAEVTLPVDVDTAAVSGAVEEAVADVDAVVSPEVEVDTSDAVETITTDIEAAAPTVTIDADAAAAADSAAAEITDAIEGVAPVVEVVPEVDTSAIESEVTDAIADISDASVVVTADTSAASEALADLAAEVDHATNASTGFGDAANSIGVVSGLASGSIEGLTSAVSGSGAAIAGAAAAGVGFGAFVVDIIGQASAAERAQTRFNNVFGEFADQVNHIDVGGLDDDIGGLAIRIGATDEKLQLAAAKIGDLGRTSGVAAPQVAKTAEQIVALAAHLSVTNPALGDAGDIANDLTASLARGGRALAKYGISLSTAEINARAFQDTGKTTAADLTIFDKAAAAAAIRIEQLGTSLGTELNEGAGQAEIRLAALRTEVEETLEAMGGPLLDSAVTLAEGLTPIATSLGTLLGEVAGAVVPLVASVAEGLGPAIGHVVDAVVDLVEATEPVVDLLGQGVAVAAETAALPVEALAVALEAIPDDAVATAAALGALYGVAVTVPGAVIGITNVVGSLAIAASSAVPALTGAAEATVSAGAAIQSAAGPIGIGIAAIAAVAYVVHSVSEARKQERAEIAATETALFGEIEARNAAAEATAIQQAAIEGSTDALAKFLQADPESALADQADTLADLGLTYERLADLIRDPTAGYLEFTRALATNAEGAQLTGAEYDDLVAQIVALGNSTADQSKKLDLQHKIVTALTGAERDLLDAFGEEFTQVNKAAEARARLLLTTEKVTEAQYDYAVAQATGADGTVSYLAVVDSLTTGIESVANATRTYTQEQAILFAKADEAPVAIENQRQAWDALALAIADGTVATEDYAAVADQFGVSAEVIAEFATQSTAAVAQFTEQIMGALPSTNDAVKDWVSGIDDALGELSKVAADQEATSADLKAAMDAAVAATDPQRLIENLDKQREQIEQFQANVQTLFASGNIRAAEEALRLGPVVGGALADSLANAEPAVAAAANNAFLGVDAAQADLAARVRTEWAPRILTATGDLSQSITEQFGLTLQGLPESLRVNLLAMATEFGVLSPQFSQAASAAGITVGEAYAASVDLVGPTRAATDLIAPAIRAVIPDLSTASVEAAVALVSSYGANVAQVPIDTVATFAQAVSGIVAAQPSLGAQAAATAFYTASTYAAGLDPVGSFTQEQFNAAVVSIQASQPGMTTAAAQAALATVIAMQGSLAGLPVAVGAKAGEAKGALSTGLDGISAAAGQFGTDATSALDQNLKPREPAAAAFGQVPAAITEKQGAAETAAAESGTATGTSFTDALVASLDSGRSQVDTTTGLVIAALAGYQTQASSAGRAVGAAFDAGIAAGIAENAQGVRSAAARVIADAVAAAKAEAGIASPSKVMREVGGWMAEGLSVGIADQAGAVADAAAKAVTGATAAARKRAQSDPLFAFGLERPVPAKDDVSGTQVLSASQSVLRTLERALTGVTEAAVSAARPRADRVVAGTAADVARLIAESVTTLGATDRAGLTAGTVSLADVISPVADAIDAAVGVRQDRLGKVLDGIETPIVTAIERGMGKASTALDRFVNPPARTRDRNVDTRGADPQADRRGDVSITIPITVEASPGVTPEAARAIGREVGNSAADVLQRRRVRAAVRT